MLFVRLNGLSIVPLDAVGWRIHLLRMPSIATKIVLNFDQYAT